MIASISKYVIPPVTSHFYLNLAKGTSDPTCDSIFLQGSSCPLTCCDLFGSECKPKKTVSYWLESIRSFYLLLSEIVVISSIQFS